jgi:hydroxymethylpyrimidine/phosphomethylpyrimidine kinase
MTGAPRTPCALTIAGSDSGGGAGIQADLKAFARCGVHGTSAITAITAQNTLGVQAVHVVPTDAILAQIRAVAQDIAIDAVKVGMLATSEVVQAVAQALRELPASTPIVVDPVMVAESGAQLLDTDARAALVSEIVPLASVVTPNLPEAMVLAGQAVPLAGEAAPGAGQAAPPAGEVAPGAEEDPEAQERTYALLRALLELGPRAVILTGGHRGEATDLLVEADAPERIVSIPGERHPGGAAHGSGCTHSSVLAAQLAQGLPLLQAAFAARALAGAAVADGLRDVGEGVGPVDIIGLARVRARR